MAPKVKQPVGNREIEKPEAIHNQYAIPAPETAIQRGFPPQPPGYSNSELLPLPQEANVYEEDDDFEWPLPPPPFAEIPAVYLETQSEGVPLPHSTQNGSYIGDAADQEDKVGIEDYQPQIHSTDQVMRDTADPSVPFPQPDSLVPTEKVLVGPEQISQHKSADQARPIYNDDQPKIATAADRPSRPHDFTVLINLNGKAATFLLDTGASMSPLLTLSTCTNCTMVTRLCDIQVLPERSKQSVVNI